MFKIFSYLLDEGQSEFPDSIDKFAGSYAFLVLFWRPKMGKLPQSSLKGHLPDHVEDLGDLDEGQSQFPDRQI